MDERMTTHTRPRSPVIIVCVMLLAATAVALPHIGQLPMTRHAKRSHKREMVNAKKMIALIESDRCKDMRVYHCPKERTYKILCQVTPNVCGGLVLGNMGLDLVVITGYGACTQYWAENMKDCYQTEELPFALP